MSWRGLKLHCEGALFAALVSAAAVAASGCGARPADHPEPIVVAHGDAGSPTAAIHPSTGDVFWSWFARVDTSADGVYMARLDAGASAASEPVRVDDGRALVNRHAQAPAQVAVGPEGTVYVAWTTRIDIAGRRFPASNLVVARSGDGGRTFEAPVYVNEDYDGEPAGHTFHHMAVGPDGTLYVSWLDSRTRTGHGGAVRARETAEHGHVGGEGSESHHGSDTDLRIARSTDGGRSFEPSTVVARGTCECCRTAITVDAAGVVHIAWRQLYDENVRDIAYALSRDGGQTFTEPVRVHDDRWSIEACPHNGPSIAAESDETVRISWFTATERAPGAYVTSGSRDGGFRAPSVLLRGPSGAHTAVAAGGFTAWEVPAEGRVRFRVDGEATTHSFEGSAPDLTARGGTYVLSFASPGGLEAVVDRR